MTREGGVRPGAGDRDHGAGGEAGRPNGTIASLNITPTTATATKTVKTSVAGALTISAVYATPSYVNGTGVSATAGFQTLVSRGEDADGAFGVVGSAPGATRRRRTRGR